MLRERRSRFALVATALLFGCGDSEIVAIARNPVVVDASSVVDVAAIPGDEVTDAASVVPPDDAPIDSPAEASPEAGPSVSARARVQVRDGSLLTDKGTRLRGVTINIDSNPNFNLSKPSFDQLSNVYGLNTVHVYLENWETTTGANERIANQIVDLAARAQLYVIIGIGGGGQGPNHDMGSGTFSITKVREFWAHYAPLYADRTHVIYEIENYPDMRCDKVWGNDTFAMEREAYSIIRRAAPDTHVLLFSFGGTPTASVLLSSIDKVSETVDWSNASVAMHSPDGCASIGEVEAVVKAAHDHVTGTGTGVASLISEIPATATASMTGTFETAKVGWISFRWLVSDQNLATMKQQYNSANVTWCPDYGTWPKNSRTCGMQ